MAKFTSKVRFAKEEDPWDCDHLQYVNGRWYRCLDGRIIYLDAVSQWFKPLRWAGFEVTAVDTSAYGGGRSWSERVTPWFDSEIEALQHMSTMKDEDAADRE